MAEFDRPLDDFIKSARKPSKKVKLKKAGGGDGSEHESDVEAENKWGIKIQVIRGDIPMIDIPKDNPLDQCASNLLQTVTGSTSKVASLFDYTDGDNDPDFKAIMKQCLSMGHGKEYIMPARMRISGCEDIRGVGLSGKRSVMVALTVAMVIHQKMDIEDLLKEVCEYEPALEEPFKDICRIACRAAKVPFNTGASNRWRGGGSDWANADKSDEWAWTDYGNDPGNAGNGDWNAKSQPSQWTAWEDKDSRGSQKQSWGEDRNGYPSERSRPRDNHQRDASPDSRQGQSRPRSQGRQRIVLLRTSHDSRGRDSLRNSPGPSRKRQREDNGHGNIQLGRMHMYEIMASNGEWYRATVVWKKDDGRYEAQLEGNGRQVTYPNVVRKDIRMSTEQPEHHSRHRGRSQQDVDRKQREVSASRSGDNRHGSGRVVSAGRRHYEPQREPSPARSGRGSDATQNQGSAMFRRCW